MKSCFVKLNCLEDTMDNTVTINANNISTIKRITYNDVVQTMVTMIGGERFGVTETPEEIMEIFEQEFSKEAAY